MEIKLSKSALADLREVCKKCGTEKLDMIIDLETDNFIYENPTESFEQIRPTMEAQALREVQDNICPECHHWDEVNAKLDNSEL